MSNKSGEGTIIGIICACTILPIALIIVAIIYFSIPNARQIRIDRHNLHVDEWDKSLKSSMDSIDAFDFSIDLGSIDNNCFFSKKFENLGIGTDNPQPKDPEQSCFSHSASLGEKMFNEDESPLSFTISYKGKEIGSFETYIFGLRKSYYGGKRASYYCKEDGGTYEFVWYGSNCFFYEYLKRVCLVFDPASGDFVLPSDDATDVGCFDDGEISLYDTGSKSQVFSDFSFPIEIRSKDDPHVLFYQENTYITYESLETFGQSHQIHLTTGGVLLGIAVFPIIFLVIFIGLMLYCICNDMKNRRKLKYSFDDNTNATSEFELQKKKEESTPKTVVMPDKEAKPEQEQSELNVSNEYVPEWTQSQAQNENIKNGESPNSHKAKLEQEEYNQIFFNGTNEQENVYPNFSDIMY